MRESVTLWTCDRCKNRDVEGMRTLTLTVGTRYNGVDTETITEEVDLCPDYMLGLVRSFVGKNHDEAKAWVDKLRR